MIPTTCTVSTSSSRVFGPCLIGIALRQRCLPCSSAFPTLGLPGPLVHELEAIPDYLPLLRDPLRRQPTSYGFWMVNRLNTKLPGEQRESRLSELRAALEHPLASEQTRKAAERYLTYQS